MQTHLLENDTIDIVGDIDGNMVIYVREAIVRAMSQPQAKQNQWLDLLILMSSNGGSIPYGLDIYDLLKNYPGRTIGRVYSGANSMGAVILQACDWRQCLPHAGILIHNPWLDKLTWDEAHNPEQLQKRLNSLDHERQEMLEILSKRSGQTFDKIAEVCAKNTDLTAKEALELGLIDEIYQLEKRSYS